MAVISLNTNLSSLQTQRELARSTSSLSKSFERLSSGLRVSRAADDAAGLAVASGLNVDARVFSQGLRNLSDGASVTNIVEGALSELTNIVLRLEELAEQAANGTLGQKQRSALDAEAQALSKEYFRIAQTTEFNGRKLVDGSVQGLSLQAGYGTNGMLQSSLGGELGTGRFQAAMNFGTGLRPMSVTVGDLNGDGILDLVCANTGNSTAGIFLGNGDGTFKAMHSVGTGSTSVSVALGDLTGDGVLDIVSGHYNDSSVSVIIGNGDGSFKTKTDFAAALKPQFIALGDLDGDGALDIVSANRLSANVSVFLGNGDGGFEAKTDFAAAATPCSAALGDLNGDGILDVVSSGWTSTAVLLGNGDGSFNVKADYGTGGGARSIALGDLNGDGALDIVTGRNAGTNAAVLLGNGDGSFETQTDAATGLMPLSVALGDLNGDGILDLVSANMGGDSVSSVLGNGDGTFKAKTDFATGAEAFSVAVGDLNGDGVFDIVAANYYDDTVSTLIAETRDGVSPLLPFSLRTKADADWALELMKQKLTQLSRQRGIIGANQSRLSTAMANLQVERENYLSAGSQITDVDVASETSQLLKTRILQQAASAVLAQANQAPALGLKLLSG